MNKIKWIGGIVLALACAAFAQTPQTVTGTELGIPGGGCVGGTGGTNCYVNFRLRNYQGTAPRVVGIGTLVPLQFQVIPNSSGVWSTTLYTNDVITPDNCGPLANLACTFYEVDFFAGGRQISSANWQLTGSGPFNLNTLAPLTGAPPPPPPFIPVVQNPVGEQIISNFELAIQAPGTFTNTQMNEYLTSSVNGCNTGTEMHADPFFGGNQTDAVSGCVINPSTSNVSGIGVLGIIVQSSNTASGTAGLFTANANASDSIVVGVQGVAWDTVNPAWVTLELEGGAFGVSTNNGSGNNVYETLAGVSSTAFFSAPPSLTWVGSPNTPIGNGFECDSATTNSWNNCLTSQDGGAGVGLSIGTVLAASGASKSQAIRLRARTSGTTDTSFDIIGFGTVPSGTCTNNTLGVNVAAVATGTMLYECVGGTSTWAGVDGGGGGGVSGSGTAGLIPVWTGTTSLGNSDIQDNAGVSIILSSQGAPAALTGNTAVFATNAPSGACTTGVLVFPLVAYNQGCQTFRGIESLAGAGTGTIIAGSFFAQPASSGPVLSIGVLGTVQPGTTPTANNIGVYGSCNINNAGVTLANCRGAFLYGNNGGTTTIASMEGLAAETSVTVNGGTTTTDATIHILSPSITGSGVMTHHYGLLIEDQTGATSGTNSDPHGIGQLGNAPNMFTGHLTQNASGNWAGTCTMSTTTCTITLSASYTSTPGCVATVQGASPIAAACSVSGTTVTITAASSNTATWAAFTFGNPN